jgi:predicted phosphoadenosine phosphosulfate sulfurtransferase
MKVYLDNNVLTEARKRISWLFEEFDNVVVGYSGGKDSTVVLELTLEEARKRNRLPVPVLFIDQEAEWQGTIEMVREVMYRPEVKPMWFQMPMVITNNASSFERYSYCWAEGKDNEWIHAKDPISIRENKYGTERFHELFEAIFKVEFAKESACYIAGMRAQESPKRAMSLTYMETYKGVTWGKILNKNKKHYTFYPIYDWEISDVWKSIHEHGWKYNDIYNEMYRHGVNIRDMRISNLHHETAVQNLLLVQEIEPETWDKIANRVDGANTIKHLTSDAFKCPAVLPSMFKDWEEYALYLADNLIQEDKNKKILINGIETYQKFLINDLVKTDFYRVVVATILVSDWDLTKIVNFTRSHDFNTVRKYVNGQITEKNYAINKQWNKYIQI